jgi:heparosan-N-sulfate-glucuronate 5-epimerase
MIVRRYHYYQRIFAAYLGKGTSQLTFWHDIPEVNERCVPGEVGEYYMPFLQKAQYAGPFDDCGIPQLDYRGVVGRQYNPIAIAQYGLGNYNLWRRTDKEEHRSKFIRVADWLVSNLERNRAGLPVWMHHFDWDYRDRLMAPWYSALAQGQGISLLVRAHDATSNPLYMEAALDALEAFKVPVREGGVVFTDLKGQLWFEEYIVDPPTHILNGFLWASWGIYDLSISGNADAKKLFDASLQTLKQELPSFDTGYWSLYEQSGTLLPMTASHFYHRLHIAQLRVHHRLTAESIFEQYADRWENYLQSPWKQRRALASKAAFKLCYY